MMTMLKTLITSRDPKGLHIVGLFEATLNKIGLDDERAQCIIESGGEFQENLREILEKYSATNQFAAEEVSSSYGYLSGYKPKGIAEQASILRQLFSGIGSINEQLVQRPLPENAEGWFAIPRWQKIAPTYAEAVQKVLDTIEKTRGNLYNYRGGQIDAQHLRQSAKTAKMFEVFGEQQKDCDILVISSSVLTPSASGLCSLRTRNGSSIATISGSIVLATNFPMVGTRLSAKLRTSASVMARSSSMRSFSTLSAASLVRRPPSSRSKKLMS
jgi:hypothetical protein